MKRNLIILFWLLIALGCSTSSIDSKSINQKPTMDVSKSELHQELTKLLSEFESINHRFLFDVSKGDTVILQVVHPFDIPELNESDFGLVIYLTFDPSFESTIAQHKMFMESEISKSFVAFTWSGIPCYAFNVATDVNKASETLKLVLEAIGEFGPFNYEYYDQGQI